jgi:hypothetical protein
MVLYNVSRHCLTVVDTHRAPYDVECEYSGLPLRLHVVHDAGAVYFVWGVWVRLHWLANLLQLLYGVQNDGRGDCPVIPILPLTPRVVLGTYVAYGAGGV